MTLHDLALKALKYGIPATVILLAGVWLWVKFAAIASGAVA